MAGLAACHSKSAQPRIDTIEIESTGHFAETFTVHSDGRGEYEGPQEFLDKRLRTFTLKPGEFERVSSDLRPYLNSAKPVADKSIYDKTCKYPSIDAGGFYVRWQGPHLDDHKWLDYGCEHWWWRWLPRYKQVRNAYDELQQHIER